MTDFGGSGGTLPLWVQLPASAVLVVILLLALRMVNSRNARFVIFACWLRFMLSAFHEYTFPKMVTAFDKRIRFGRPVHARLLILPGCCC